MRTASGRSSPLISRTGTNRYLPSIAMYFLKFSFVATLTIDILSTSQFPTVPMATFASTESIELPAHELVSGHWLGTNPSR
jgi:hypothetical protein